VNQLLDYRKLDSGNEMLNLVYEDLANYIFHVGKLFQPLAQNKNIVFTIHSGQQTLFTCFDPDKLERTISNLLSNAIKFTPENGSIELIVEQRNTTDESEAKGNIAEPSHKYVQITIRDSGKGITDAEKSKIFNPFYQSSNNDSFNHRGFGIGLAMAKEYVNMHNGIILVKDNMNCISGKATGTEFIVKLPVSGPEKATDLTEFLSGNAEPTNDQDERSTGSNSGYEGEISDQYPVLLVVEDNQDMQYYIRQELSNQFRIVEAMDGNKGYELALNLVPDLIITDYLMPDISGIELCRFLKTNIITSHIPVILLTALSGDEYKIEGLETGADDYIIKPFNPEVLKVRINNLIDTRKKLQDKYQLCIGLKNKAAATNATDRKFLNCLFEIIEKELDNPNIEVQYITREIGMSKTQLYKKIKAITGQTLFEFINTTRLKKGAEIILEEDITISEVSQRVGFSSLSVFTRSFTRQFKMSPTRYAALYKSIKK
jgi:DNA-binding response OmpR family regulator